MPSKSETRPLALVTGASSGLGASFADRLARDGYDLIVVARRSDRLEQLSKRLRDERHVNVEVVAADLSKSADVRSLEKRLAAEDRLEFLVNNAGFGGYMPFVQLDPDKAEELINLQVLAVVRLTRAGLPGMVARKHGTIINVASRLGFSRSMGESRLPKRATYAGSKAFIITFTQLLQTELDGTGVKMQALCPGVVETEFHEVMGWPPDQIPASMVMKPEDVVEASLAGLRSGEVICLPALNDPTLLSRLEEDERQLLQGSGSGDIAARYKS